MDGARLANVWEMFTRDKLREDGTLSMSGHAPTTGSVNAQHTLMPLSEV
jgi:hypothetical protein